MTRRLRIAIGSAIILVGLLAIVVLSFLGVTRTSVGQERVRRMVASMLEGKVKGKVYIGHMTGGLVGGVRIDSVEIRDDEDSVFFASGPITVSYDPRDLFDRRILLSQLEAEAARERGLELQKDLPSQRREGEAQRARLRPIYRRRFIGDPRCHRAADAALASIGYTARSQAR
jgi:autotransporter translocation and assembly factor TamB